MYKATVRAGLRFAVKKLNEGDPSLFLRTARPDATIAFPGNNSWATMFRPVAPGRAVHITHDGIDECRAFAERFVAEGVQFEIEDIAVNGPPWRTRIALRVVSFVPGANGASDVYNNRAVAWMETRWGRLVSWEDYEDCQRVAAWDQLRLAVDS